MEEVTHLLLRWKDGDDQAFQELTTLLYGHLRNTAASMLRSQWSGARMQPTELVHEAYLKIYPLQDLGWKDRAHFMALAATVMRQVLMDQYRRANAGKRQHEPVTLVTASLEHPTAEQEYNFSDLLEAMQDLDDVSQDYSRVVELKFFGGLTHEEIAEYDGVSPATVKRRWRAARAWLQLRLDAGHDGQHAPSPP